MPFVCVWASTDGFCVQSLDLFCFATQFSGQSAEAISSVVETLSAQPGCTVCSVRCAYDHYANNAFIYVETNFRLVQLVEAPFKLAGMQSVAFTSYDPSDVETALSAFKHVMALSQKFGYNLLSFGPTPTIEAIAAARKSEAETLRLENERLKAGLAVQRKKVAEVLYVMSMRDEASAAKLKAADELTAKACAEKDVEIKKQTKEIKELEERLDQEMEENGNLHKENESLLEFRTDYNRLKAKNQSLSAQVKTLQSKFDNERAECAYNGDKLDEAQRTIFSLEHKCDEILADKRALEAKLKKIEETPPAVELTPFQKYMINSAEPRRVREPRKP